MKGCNSGADFSKDVAMGLKARNIETIDLFSCSEPSPPTETTR
jgi:hypothetical protein